MKTANIYDFSLAANGSFQLNVEGDYVRIMSSTGTVELVTDNYKIGPIASGQGQSNSPFKRLTINNKSGLANKGLILIASSDFVDQRISGEVSVIDGAKARTIAISAFAAGSNIIGVASQYSFSGLYNPAGSGVNCIVNDLTFSAPSPQLVIVSGGSGVPPGIIYQPVAKMAGDATQSKTKKYEGTSVADPSGGATAMFAVSVLGGVSGQIKLTEPIVIAPGKFLMVFGATQFVDLQVSRQFFEEPL